MINSKNLKFQDTQLETLKDAVGEVLHGSLKGAPLGVGVDENDFTAFLVKNLNFDSIEDLKKDESALESFDTMFATLAFLQQTIEGYGKGEQWTGEHGENVKEILEPLLKS